MNIDMESEWNRLDPAQRQYLLSLGKSVTLRYWIIRGGIAAFTLIVLLMAGGPQYNVWQQGLAGEAELKRATQNRQIEIERAAAVKAAAGDLASAEVIRAKGVFDANEIIAEGLGGPDGYLRYLFINGLNGPDSTCETIYIPTEANLPILETVRPLSNE